MSVQPDGSFDLWLNAAGRDLLVKKLQALSEAWDHLHLDHYDDPDIADATDIPLSAVPYQAGDRVLLNGKVLFRPDEWDLKAFPHVLTESGPAVR
ncbi:hypothetical protein [Phenylobacterium aquaticum]|uniref:hypothetical protein n=1 Tax=Phenylobacterium aquaticum TaxID=1763816 RepID=UPI001F5DC2E9|nr:hypothetical protein [Phenylobacterium aquaticum]MCI3132168.1 hypothetical protein [Phenylobacterium aquaticum]